MTEAFAVLRRHAHTNSQKLKVLANLLVSRELRVSQVLEHDAQRQPADGLSRLVHLQAILSSHKSSRIGRHRGVLCLGAVAFSPRELAVKQD